MRVAALAHRSQTRKACDLPYLVHPASVALILASAGFSDPTMMAAALLHDVIEDTDYDVAACRRDFPSEVVDLVLAASELKCDEQGQKLKWITRKREHLERLQSACLNTKAIVLADKLHNLVSMVFDNELDPSFWSRFNAGSRDILWYYESMAELGATSDDARLQSLARDCRAQIERLRETA